MTKEFCDICEKPAVYIGGASNGLKHLISNGRVDKVYPLGNDPIRVEPKIIRAYTMHGIQAHLCQECLVSALEKLLEEAKKQ